MVEPTKILAADQHQLALVQTVEDNLQRYTKREVSVETLTLMSLATRARDMLCKMGYPSVQQAIAMVESGMNFDITAHDFRIAEAIWGPDIASLKGKTRKMGTAPADTVIAPIVAQQDQVLSVDVMFTDGVATLVGLASPLGLTLAATLTSFDTYRGPRSTAVIKAALDGFIATLASRNFKTRIIMADGEGAIGKLKTALNLDGIEVDISGAGGHVPVIERRIQVIKQRVRAYMSHRLPYTLNTQGIGYCVLFCVSRLNYEVPGTRPMGPSPREILTGARARGDLDFRCSIGDFALTTVPQTTNSPTSRVEEAIIMLPTGNRIGSVKFLNLRTNKIVTRDEFKILPIPPYIITAMNELALRDGRKLTTKTTVHFGPHTSDGPVLIANPPQRPVDALTDDDLPPLHAVPLSAATAATDNQFAIGVYDDAATVEVPLNKNADALGVRRKEYVKQDGIAENDFADGNVATTARTAANQVPDMSLPPPEGAQNTTQTANATKVMDYFRRGVVGLDSAMVTGTTAQAWSTDSGTMTRTSEEEYALKITVKEALRTRGAEAEKLIMQVLEQMMERRVWTAVKLRDLSIREKMDIIRSSMFLKMKVYPDGKPDKLKARLVAGGNQQDRTLYDDLSAPTVSTSAVLTILSVAAHERRKVAVVDIGGAFLNANMDTGILVHMRLDATMSGLLCRLDPRYKDFMDSRGCIVVRLDKALYGCVESAALWYDNLSKSMQNLGYECNEYEPCVFNRLDERGTQCTATVHVDDLFISSRSPSMIEHLCEGLKTRYGDITRNR
jgi:Reverse transcriptase (RNA-dependent DNA polymerase)